jgi:hypothetical protein
MQKTIKQQVQDILIEHNLDFTIEKVPLVGLRTGPDGKTTQATTPYYGLYNSKTNTCINTVKAGYGVSQNADLVEAVLLGSQDYTSKLKVSKAGALNDGKQVYIQMAINGLSKVNGADEIIRYVTIIDSNDGSTSLSVGIGDLTMSCKNQFYKFYAKGQAKFRHTATIEEKIKQLPNLIKLALGESLRQIEIYNAFQSTKVSRDLANQLVLEILGYDRVITSQAEQAKLKQVSVNRMASLYNHIEKETLDKGLNLWGMHSGVTSWTTHEKAGPKRENGKAETMIIGSAYKDNMTSFKWAEKQLELLS